MRTGCWAPPGGSWCRGPGRGLRLCISAEFLLLLLLLLPAQRPHFENHWSNYLKYTI